MPFIKLTRVERRRILVIFFCLLLAIASWLFLALNNKYVYNVKTVLVYKNFPQKKAFHPLQSDTVDLQVEGTGWQLVFSRLRINPQSISVSLNTLNSRNFVVFSEQLYNINKQLETSQKVISIHPDTLYFDFSKRTVKRVPIQLIKQLAFVKQYNIASPIVLTPKFITISGPQEELEKIHSWPTDTLILKNIQNTAVARVGLKQTELKNVNIFPNNVEVKIPIDEFTEKTIEVPLRVLNNSDFLNIKLYPKKIKVTFLVALNSFQQVDEDFIEACVDVNDWKILHHSKLTVKITRFPEYCKFMSISPNKIDFVIEK